VRSSPLPGNSEILTDMASFLVRTDPLAPANRDLKFGYLHGLDGWRAIAILSVILYHSTVHTLGIFSTAWASRFGYLGVDVFFAISGLLITSKLLEEEKRSGHISLRNFYLRRAFRILPAAIFYLGSIALLAGLGWIYVSRMEWLASLFFYRNYSSLYHIEQTLGLPWFTTHFWSLSLEEHFYLLLPPLLVLTRRKARIASLAGIIVAVIVHRQFELAHREWFTIAFHTDTRLDALLIPALFAVLARSEVFSEHFNSFVRKWHLAFLLAFFLVVYWPEGSGLQITAIAMVMPAIVLGTVLKPESLGTRILEWRPLRWIGRISYSLYLWQQLFFTERFLWWRPLGRLEAWPLNLVLTFLMAALSYYAIERPLIRLGHRLTTVPSNVIATAGEAV
jgi:peptidoglycan/LPS O-acetylase OafA/YrhL